MTVEKQAAVTRSFLTRRYQAETFVYSIDIVSTCNLGCVSCPVGNTPLGSASRGKQPRGFMPFDRCSAISLSGFTQSTYGRTHTNGNIDVIIGYHDYIGNDGDELASMEALAEELGFWGETQGRAATRSRRPCPCIATPAS